MLNNIVNKVKGKANSLDVEILTDKSKFPECEKIENENDYVGVKLKRDPEHEVEVWFYFISSCGPDIYDGEQLDAYAALCMENMVLRTYRSRIEQDGSCSQMLQQANFYGKKEEMEIVNKAQREALKYLQKREKINQGEQQRPDDQVAQICREFWGNKALIR